MPIGSVGQVQDLARCRDDRFVSCPRHGEMLPTRLAGSTNASYTETGPGRSPDPVFDPEVGGAERRLLRRLYLDSGDHLLVALVLEAGLHVRAGCEVLAVDPDRCRNHELCAVREETTRGHGKIYDEAERLGRSVPPRPSPVAESCYRFMLPFVLCWLGITSTRVAIFFVSRRSYDALTFSPSRMSDRVA